MRAILVGVLVAGCAVEEAHVEVDESAIINGWEDNFNVAVGLESVSGCSAVLVGYRTALTAAHCVSNGGEAAFWSPESNQLAVRGTAFEYPLSDMAVIKLDEDYTAKTGIQPIRIARAAPYYFETIMPVGFGCTVWDTNTGYGTRRYGYNHIDEVNGKSFQFDGSQGMSRICDGDSGGPVLEYYRPTCVIGINHGRQHWVWGGDDIAMRVDVANAWIKAVAGDWTVLDCGQCPPTGCSGGGGSTPVCGDGSCNGSETTATCSDCYCGDTTCSSDEDVHSCQPDCCGGINTSCSSDIDCCSAPCINGLCGAAE